MALCKREMFKEKRTFVQEESNPQKNVQETRVKCANSCVLTMTIIELTGTFIRRGTICDKAAGEAVRWKLQIASSSNERRFHWSQRWKEWNKWMNDINPRPAVAAFSLFSAFEMTLLQLLYWYISICTIENTLICKSMFAFLMHVDDEGWWTLNIGLAQRGKKGDSHPKKWTLLFLHTMESDLKKWQKRERKVKKKRNPGMCSQYRTLDVSECSVLPYLFGSSVPRGFTPAPSSRSMLMLDQSLGLHLLSHPLDGARRLVRRFSDRFLGLFAGFLSSFRERGQRRCTQFSV